MKPCRLLCQVNLPDSHPYEVAGTGVQPQIVRCRADPSGRWAASAKRDQMGVCSGVISRWGSQPGSSLAHGTFQLCKKCGTPQIYRTTPKVYCPSGSRFDEHRAPGLLQVCQVPEERVRHPQTPVSRETVNSRLLERGYPVKRPAKKPRLTAHHKVQRLQHAREHQRFMLNRVDGIHRVRRVTNERFTEACVTPTVASGGGSVHLWAPSIMVSFRTSSSGSQRQCSTVQERSAWKRATMGSCPLPA